MRNNENIGFFYRNEKLTGTYIYGSSFQLLLRRPTKNCVKTSIRQKFHWNILSSTSN